MTLNTEGLKKENSLIERIRWLIRLRWIAAFGVIAAVFVVSFVEGISLPSGHLYAVAAFLLFYNALLSLFMFSFEKKLRTTFFWGVRLANIQISVDLMCLAVLLYFSGGVENPFIFLNGGI